MAKSENSLTVMVVALGHAIHTNIHTKRFLETLISHGNRVIGVCEGNPFPGKKEGFRFVRLTHPPPGFCLISPFLKMFLHRNRVERIRIKATGLCLKLLWLWFRPAVVHKVWINSPANACLSGGLKPLALTCWGSDINEHFLPDADPFRRELCRQALSGADLVIANTPDIMQKCKEIAGRDIKLALVSLGGADTNRFAPKPPDVRKAWRDRLNIPLNARVLLSLRGWHAMYRHHLILEAFSGAYKRIPADTILVFMITNLVSYPDSKGYKESLCRRAEELGIHEKIRWLDAVPHEKMPEVYAFSDIIVSYPNRDGLPVTLMEAAACKRYIIACDWPGYRGTFIEKYARLVPMDDIKKLGDAMAEAVNTPSLTDNNPLLDEARHVIEEQYSYEVFSRQLKAINETLAATAI